MSRYERRMNRKARIREGNNGDYEATAGSIGESSKKPSRKNAQKKTTKKKVSK